MFKDSINTVNYNDMEGSQGKTKKNFLEITCLRVYYISEIQFCNSMMEKARTKSTCKQTYNNLYDHAGSQRKSCPPLGIGKELVPH